MADEPAKIILGDTIISALEQPPTRRFARRWKEQRPLTHCENCGAELTGHYCAQCGQPAIDYRRSFRHVIVDVLDSFLNWDSRFFATIALLIAKPWQLTNEYVTGKRVRHVNPLRLYLLTSIVFFFAVNYSVKSLRFEPINLSPENRAEIRAELERENVAPEIRAKVEEALGKTMPPEKRAALEERLKNANLPEEARDAIKEQLEHGDVTRVARGKLEDAMKDLPPEARAKLDQSLQKAAEKPVVFTSDKNDQPHELGQWFEKRAKTTLFTNLPYMMLCCVPLFALVLKILYLRRRIFYIDHLIYALHVHAFAYLGIMLIVLATIGLNRVAPGAIANWAIALLWIWFVLQIFLSIRRVYRQGWLISVIKFCFGGVAYLMVLSIALFVTFLATLALP
ncbi:MAG: hypothetical protein DME34_08760 [Verrucomicrobia bacterium]|nr:MAG: hypothetical protein DME34_08760 [Verrucomicrobiota bacterium]